jgi:inhibitor of cysteine peptidase
MADKLVRTMFVMTFLLILALFSGCGTRGTSLTEAENGQQVILGPSESLTITLQSNPTTGYSWQVLEIDPTVLAQEGDPEYRQSPGSEGLVGAGGTETFHFKAAESGETSLKLGYMRTWESEPPVETFEIRVVVQG